MTLAPRRMPSWSRSSARSQRRQPRCLSADQRASRGAPCRAARSRRPPLPPEWFNVYNRVVVDLATHDAQGITRLDFELADHMQVLAAAG